MIQKLYQNASKTFYCKEAGGGGGVPPPMYDVRLKSFTIYDLRFAKFPRLRAILAKQVRTRVDETVRGVWRPFRGCLFCWIVLQSGPRPSGRGSGRAFIIMKNAQNQKLTELVLFLAENAELIEKAIYLLFVMLN